MNTTATTEGATIACSLGAEIIVAGDGPVGLMAALAMADAGRETLLIAPSWNETEATANNDARTAAILGQGLTLLQDLRVWAELEPACAPVKRLRSVNAKAGPARLRRGDCTFDAAEIGEAEFGWNVPVGALRAGLRQAVEVRPHLRVIEGRRVRSLLPASGGFDVELDDGRRLEGGLILAADGRGSKLRQEAGIDAKDVDLGQSAIVCSFDHARSHAHTSIELHRDGGPFTTVPLPGRRSSLVWVMPHDEAIELQNMQPERFFARLEHIVEPWLGRIDNLSVPGLWPLRRVLASSLARQNLLLIGETAHAFSPIGAQGLNLSIRDIVCLRGLVEALEPSEIAPLDAQCGTELGKRYGRRRLIDVQSRSQAVRFLNDFVANRSFVGGMVQEMGLQVLKSVPILRQLAMQGLMPPRISSI